MSHDGMERLTEAMLISVIRQYIPFIFGARAEVVEASEMTSLGIRPDFVVSLAENYYAIAEVKNQSPNTQLRLDAVASQLLSYYDAFKHFHPALG